MSDIQLMPEQLQFITSTQPIVAYIGGIGAGKSYVACIKAVKMASVGRTQLMIGLTYSSARDVLLVALYKVLDLFGYVSGYHYKINLSTMDVKFRGGGKILIRSAEIGDKLRGINASDVYIDEAAYLKTDEVFKILLGRMRETPDAQIHLTTSPKSFNWVYDITQSSDCEMIKVSTFKNPFLPDRYIKNMLKQYSSTFIRQELYADFVNMSSGLFKSEWIKSFNADEDLIKKYGTAKKIRFWDLAFSTNGDYTAGVLLAKVGNKFVVEDIVRVRQEYSDLRKTIITTAHKDGRDVMIGIEQAGQQKAIVSDLSSIPELNMYNKRALKVSKYGHKIKRILPLSSLAENGNLYIHVDCRNKKEFMAECDALTTTDEHLNDDMVDACSSAFILFNEQFESVKGSKSNIY